MSQQIQTTTQDSICRRPLAVDRDEHIHPLINTTWKLINARSIESDVSNVATTQTIIFYCSDMLITIHLGTNKRQETWLGCRAGRE